MINNLLLSIDAVTPFFILILLGVVIKKGKMIDDHTIKQINSILFKIMFPCMVFNNIYKPIDGSQIDHTLLIYSIVGTIVVWLISMVVVIKIEKDRFNRGAMVQAINRSNFLVIGFPIVNQICGDDNLISSTFTLVGMLLVSNMLAVVTLEIFRGNRSSASALVKRVTTNPIIISTVIGAIFMAFRIPLPYVIKTTIISLGNIASILALIVIGAAMNFRKLEDSRKKVIICLVGKLIIVPGSVCIIGALIGFRGVEFVTLLAFFGASPTTISYTMAAQQGSNSQLARDCVVYGSALVSFSMFFWIFLFKTLGLF